MKRNVKKLHKIPSLSKLSDSLDLLLVTFYCSLSSLCWTRTTTSKSPNKAADWRLSVLRGTEWHSWAPWPDKPFQKSDAERETWKLRVPVQWEQVHFVANYRHYHELLWKNHLRLLMKQLQPLKDQQTHTKTSNKPNQQQLIRFLLHSLSFYNSFIHI